ncbi:TM2 domain-containing protein [Hymenobacter endophyticus]|uniref:TM2 domain-containing protein n=1 Tax=Hymenobacter endophyticus TaxID=3076335 RepID=A0ABU3TDX7_9BACT|nr:TM2 domain-containing protein [Hymenobacter endophyticus]MDU0369591.1 TM2 domain-containing protein [Hymenobacter endophyticus]
MRNKTTAALLAFFLGAFGGQYFYLGRVGAGIACLLFSWTLIPSFIAFYHFIKFLTMSEEAFNLQYNREYFVGMMPMQMQPQGYVPVQPQAYVPMAAPAPVTPRVPAGPSAAQLFGEWLNRNAKVVGAAVAALLIGWGVYAFFIKSNPQADGQKMAAVYCDCEKQYLTAQQDTKQKYVDAQDKSASTKAKFVAELTTIGTEYTACWQRAKELESEKRSAFIGDDNAKDAFDAALTAKLGLWYAGASDNVALLDKALLAQGFSRQSLTPVASLLKSMATSRATADELLAATESGPQVEQTSSLVQSSTTNDTPAFGTDAGEETVGRTGTVSSAKAYFYSTADLADQRKAYCVRGDELVLGETVNNFVQATYTAPATGKTVVGWVKKGDIVVESVVVRSAQATAEEEEAAESAEEANGDLVGTWKGTLGDKPFTLHIERVNGNKLTGWNQVDSNRRPVTGTFTDIREDGSAVAFELALREPGTDKWDGAFELTLASPMSNAAPSFCSGTWTCYKKALTKEVTANKE